MSPAKPNVAIVDTGIANFGSLVDAVARAGGKAMVARTPEDFDEASHILFPGVGSFDAAIRTIDENGLRKKLEHKALTRGMPTLGICLGMQLLGISSEEGKLPGLGWFPGRTTRFSMPDLRVPHIGWNSIQIKRPGPILHGVDADTRFYFVHSYHYVDDAKDEVLATTNYGYDFAAVIARGNIVGTQFHPEKSKDGGLRLLRNFLEMRAA